MNTDEKSALVTGATSGIGNVIASELARSGYRVSITARDRAKGERVLAQIATVSCGVVPELLVGDLSSMADVRRIALEFRARHPALSLLVNNAGAISMRRVTSVDGMEYTVALNHLAYYLMTNLLLSPLQAAEQARVVSVASSAHRVGHVRWRESELRHPYTGIGAYCTSKLMNVLFAFALARRLEGTNVTSTVLHPGVVGSGFWDHGNWITRPAYSFIKQFAGVSPTQGADTALFLATSPDVEGVSGMYFENRTPTRAKRTAYDEAVQDRLWAWSERKVRPWLDVVE